MKTGRRTSRLEPVVSAPAVHRRVSTRSGRWPTAAFRHQTYDLFQSRPRTIFPCDACGRVRGADQTKTPEQIGRVRSLYQNADFAARVPLVWR